MEVSHQKVRGDHRGQLVAIESSTDVPFEIKRVFYIYGTENNVPRGKHAHHRTKQYLICVNGSCKVTLDNGFERTTHDLNRPYIGLLQDEMIWGEMHHFSYDCVLLVLASEVYDQADYITNYADFVRLVSK